MDGQSVMGMAFVRNWLSENGRHIASSPLTGFNESNGMNLINSWFMQIIFVTATPLLCAKMKETKTKEVGAAKQVHCVPWCAIFSTLCSMQNRIFETSVFMTVDLDLDLDFSTKKAHECVTVRNQQQWKSLQLPSATDENEMNRLSRLSFGWLWSFRNEIEFLRIAGSMAQRKKINLRKTTLTSVQLMWT